MNLRKETVGKFLAVVLLSTGVVACSEPADNSTPVSSAGEGPEQVTPKEIVA